MMSFRKILLFSLCFIFTSSFLNAGLVYFANIKGKQPGFIAKSGEDYYAYTSQCALMKIGRFALKSFSGTAISTAGDLEVSYYSDIARIKIKPGNFKDQAFELDNKIIMNSDVEVYKVSIADNIDSKSPAKVKGIGRYAFAIDQENGPDSAGCPILSSDGKVIGVLGKGYEQFVIASHWNEGKVSMEEVKNKIAARLDVNVRWVSAKKAGFSRASSEIVNSAKFQTEFVPILNWWCANPYRILSDDIKYPKDLNSWAKDLKHKTRIYDKLVEKCKQNPSDKKGLIDSLMTGTLDRSLKFTKFPQNKIRQMQIRWKTPFLQSRAKIYMKNWQDIDDIVERRLIAMEYMPPHVFAPKAAMESKKKKK